MLVKIVAIISTYLKYLFMQLRLYNYLPDNITTYLAGK